MYADWFGLNISIDVKEMFQANKLPLAMSI